jgi:hypothetical protein
MVATRISLQAIQLQNRSLNKSLLLPLKLLPFQSPVVKTKNKNSGKISLKVQSKTSQLLPKPHQKQTSTGEFSI